MGKLRVYYVHDRLVETVFDESSIAIPSGPWWSGDGQYFAVSTWVNHDSQQLMQFDAETGELIPRLAIGWEIPIPASNFEKVLAKEWESNPQLTIIAMDGTEKITINPISDGTNVEFQSWSPDSEWLLFFLMKFYIGFETMEQKYNTLRLRI